MNGRKAKKIRRLVYGDYSTKAADRNYMAVPTLDGHAKQVVANDRRRMYQYEKGR